jgi:transcriptional regulator with XRE-family HTH domain
MSGGDIAAIRRRLGLTQAAQAALLGVTVPTVQRWESGRARPPATAVIVLRLLDAGRVGVADIVAARDGAAGDDTTPPPDDRPHGDPS